MNKKLKDIIEELGWFITKEYLGWGLSKFTPLGIDFGFCITNQDFLDDLAELIDTFEVDQYIEMYRSEAININHFITREVKDLVKDAEWTKNEIIELYNAIKDLEVFNGDSRTESKEEAD